MDKFKKFLPIIIFVLALIFLVVIFLVVKNKKTEVVVDDQDTMLEVSFSDKPFASLTPTSDGHYINLKVEKIKLAKAASLDYELLYSLPDGRTQGVPGTIDLSGKDSFERKLLLGSESSGKFRYDEGVEEGTLTIRLRDSKGKLLAKFSTKFHLQSNTQEVSSIDGDFVYKLDKKSKGLFFITMETFGVMDNSLTTVESGPYGVFASSDLPAGSAEGWKILGTNIFYK